MGNTWEVYAWEVEDNGDYGYVLKYAGESRQAAMLAARKAKDAGSGCVKIEWRGN